MEEKNYWSRRLPAGEWPNQLKELALRMPAAERNDKGFTCSRCQSRMKDQLPQGAFYCRACIQLGRIRSDQELYFMRQVPFSPCQASRWTGKLSQDQESIAQDLLVKTLEGKNCLVHAVTGAGKTEMLYPLLDQFLSQGWVVGIASPRIDVCRELSVRLKRDFMVSICFLYGEGDPYQRSQLVVATIPQLFRFYRAFDLLIVDEVDAFPFDDNLQLYAAVEQAKKEEGVLHFLTATSTPRLDQRVEQGELLRLALAKRFHQQALVVPKVIYWFGYQDKRLARIFLWHFERQRRTGYPLLLFLPLIKWGQAFYQKIKQVFPKTSFGFVSSQSLERERIVEDFRQGKIDVLITTTILERGVNFPKVDVFVLEADHALYTRSSLVQIAGRVGRSPERPTGLVYFFASEQTRAMKEAIAEIKKMNQEAGF